MRKSFPYVLIVILAAVVILFMMRGRINESSEVAVTDSSRFIQIEMEVSGMVCNGCARLIEKKLTEVGGTAVVSASYPDSNVILKFDTTLTSIDSLSSAVASKGYTVKTVRKIR